jgi:hypothetical protein
MQQSEGLMKRSIRTASRALASSLAIGALATIFLGGTPTPAAAQYAPPPAEVVATLTPVYHEGHATYYYNGFWHYRDPHGAWAYYHEEPAFLHDWRGHHEVVYHHYGRR